uniref:Uncharacterized protein n=1 Tax=Hyaloperonospora arabidopsidis (strain Emoy2) TaxID=559515 RepID=M4B9J3_HYAAE
MAIAFFVLAAVLLLRMFSGLLRTIRQASAGWSRWKNGLEKVHTSALDFVHLRKLK